MAEDILGGGSDVVGGSAAVAVEKARAESAESAIVTSMAGKLAKPGSPSTYIQTFSTAARTHVVAELSTEISAVLIAELVTQLNTTNKAVNEIKKLVNAVVDDLQVTEIIK